MPPRLDPESAESELIALRLTGELLAALDAEVLKRLWQTGCRNITYAPESGSQRMLRIMDKRVDLDHMLASLRSAYAIGLKTHVNVIIGHPQERWRDLAASFGLLSGGMRRRIDLAGALVIDERTPYLSFSRSTSATRSYNPRIGARQLRIVQVLMLVWFYGLSGLMHPSRVWGWIRSSSHGGETTYLEQMLRTRRQVKGHSSSS